MILLYAARSFVFNITGNVSINASTNCVIFSIERKGEKKLDEGIRS